MAVKERLEAEMKEALRAKDADRLSCIRMLRSQLQTREVALRAERGRDYQLTDDEALAVVQSYAKQRRDSIDSYRQGGREELAASEERELAIVESYLPRQLDDAELGRIVQEVIAASGATSPRDMGAVIKGVMAKTQGAVDGRRVSSAVRTALGGG
jgi:hypothetical protein